MTLQEKTIKNREFWYKNPYVLYQMLLAGNDREIAFIHRIENWKGIRGVRARYINELKDIMFKIFRIPQQDDNVYMSVARYKEIPQFTYNLKERSKETSIWFENTSYKNIAHYDLFLDFDKGKDESDIINRRYKQELLNVLELLTTEFIKFRLLFSGNNYHIVIPSEIWGFKNKNERTIEKAKSFIMQMKERFMFKFLDTKGAGVHNKLMKMPYSLVGDRVVLPIKTLISKEFLNSQYVFKNYIIKDRGLLWLNEDKGEEQFKKFCYKYYIDM